MIWAGDGGLFTASGSISAISPRCRLVLAFEPPCPLFNFSSQIRNIVLSGGRHDLDTLAMSQWNKDQWGAQPQAPPQGYIPNAGPNPGYSSEYAPYSSAPQAPLIGPYNDVKSPYEGDRFKPKKKLNDPVFFVLFILQVRIRSHFGRAKPVLTTYLAPWICRALRYSHLFLDLEWWSWWRSWQRKYGHFRYSEPVC